MTHEEMEARLKAAIKARRAWPISDADYAAASQIIVEMTAVLAPHVAAPTEHEIDMALEKEGFRRGGNTAALEGLIYGR